jgi:predicted component of type VI protein secretion system
VVTGDEVQIGKFRLVVHVGGAAHQAPQQAQPQGPGA